METTGKNYSQLAEEIGLSNVCISGIIRGKARIGEYSGTKIKAFLERFDAPKSIPIKKAKYETIGSIRIDKDIPMPKKKSSFVYPFNNMEIGDSFAIPNDASNIRKLRSAASGFGIDNNMKFTTRVNENECRCWRVS